MKKLGLIVNPIAGMGGKVGLKGSDGREILEKAIELGAVKTAPERAVEALRKLVPLEDRIVLVTYPHDMGEDEARECGFEPEVIGAITEGETTAEDTKRAAREMLKLGVDLILFAGGDGTARDIYEAVDGEVIVLGIPAGVKIHSGVYTINPASAGELAVTYLSGGPVTVRELEVMDIDEEAFRDDRISARLYGYLRVPYERALVQGSKEGSTYQEEFLLEAIAQDVVDDMEDDTVYIIGPGSTTRTIVEKLGLKKTLLGVDVVQGGELLASDASESRLLELIEGRKATIVVTVIGGQGFIFGRGNQQISPEVIRAVGSENIIVVATAEKLASLKGGPLFVDTADSELDVELSGYVKVITGYRRRAVYRVKSYP
ncbi:MAG: ATP-NAD kinase family protein [Candidatus Bathyarchaeota archaeon]|nr:ATP-NAD kinase family protein [Candidatus Bathyarchaeota archaeon]